MSLQNLLEMDDFSEAVAGSSRNKLTEVQQPKPKPRSKVKSSSTKQLSSPIHKEKMMFATPADVFDINKSQDGSQSQYSSPTSTKQRPSRLFQASSSTKAFDNAAFITDEDDDDAPTSDISRKTNETYTTTMKQVQRNNSFDGNGNSSVDATFVAKSLAKTKKRSSVLKQNSTDANENMTGEEDTGGQSDATFTIENEKYRDPLPLYRKPPVPIANKPPPSPKASKLPRPQQKIFAKKGEKVESKVAGEKDKKETSSTAAATATKKLKGVEKKGKGYVTVQMEDQTITSDNENEGNKNTVDVSESISVSSSVNSAKNTKESKKSRFGKLFSSSDNKTNKNVLPEKDSGKVASGDDDDGGEKSGGGSKSSLMHRWKKSAHTFLKSSAPKQIDEEAGVTEAEQRDLDAVEEITTNEDKSTRDTEASTKGKEPDTTIFMPDIESLNEDGPHDSDKDEATVQPKNIEEEISKPKRKKLPLPSPMFQSKSIEKAKSEILKEKAEQKQPKYKSLTKMLKPTKEKDLSKSTDSVNDDKQMKKYENRSAKAPIPPTKVKSLPLSKTSNKETIKPGGIRKANRNKSKMTVKEPELTISSASDEDMSESDNDDGDKKTKNVGGDSSSAKKSNKTLLQKKQITQPLESISMTDTTSGRELLFGLTVHSSDVLPLDPNVIHPVVKVTAMIQNGQYMKRVPVDSSQFLNEDDQVSKGGGEGKRSKQSKRKRSEIFETTENVTESVLPIMTQPCQERHSIPTFAPTWNELLVFEEHFRRFITKNHTNTAEDEPILFFEVMDFLPMNKNGYSSSQTEFHGSENGWYKIAWAFLKPIGANGDMNVNRKLRLQLYKPIKLRTKEKLAGPEVFSWWKCGRREKVSATLYITPKGIKPPETKTKASLRQLLSMRKDQLTQAILDSQLATKKKQEASLQRSSLFELREHANWTRMEGQSCKPPNKLIAALPSSQIESLSIVISGNVHCTKFSPCGHKLAAGLDTDELHVILIFEVPSWTLLKSLKGHHGLIYDMSWKVFELDDNTSYHYLATASADSTVRIWKMDNHDVKSLSLFKILYHPSFVYSVRFHPTHPSLLATGCFDCIIRIWDVKPEHALDLAQKESKRNSKKPVKKNEVSPIILLDKHNSFVNTLSFDSVGQYLFSGDGSACVYKWSCSSPSQKRSWRLEKDVKLHHGEVPVNSIDLHPSGNRLLVHLRDNFIKILDVQSFIPLQTLNGLQNEKFQIKSCFSPCGNLVLSGSDQSTLCIWDADTGKILQFISPKNHPECTVTCVDYHPDDYYIAVGLASAISEPSPLLIYFYHKSAKMNYPLLKKTAIKMRQSLEKSGSQSQTSVNYFGNEAENHDNQTSGGGSLSTKRGNSSEKFMSIIQKLDSALYLAQQRNKQRVKETSSPNCTTSPSASAPAPLRKTAPFHTSSPELRKNGKESNMKSHKSKNSPQHKEGGTTTTVVSSNTQSVKKLVRRPSSASATKDRRDRFQKQQLIERDIKSDSEHSSRSRTRRTKQLSMTMTSEDFNNDDDNGNSPKIPKLKPKLAKMKEQEGGKTDKTLNSKPSPTIKRSNKPLKNR